MKNITILLAFLIFITSCENEIVDFQIVDSNNHAVALDTLRNYSDYILGDFNGKLLVSTDVLGKSYFGAVISNESIIDSIPIQFQIRYRLMEESFEKSARASFRLLESKTKLDSVNSYRYRYFSDFVQFFDRNTFDYYQRSHPIETEHNVLIKYQNRYEIHNDIYGYDSSDFEPQITPENFNFLVDSINVIENPIKKIEIYYSFKCIGVNFYDDEILMENGKGKSTFEY